jgi:hypothetical protein
MEGAMRHYLAGFTCSILAASISACAERVAEPQAGGADGRTPARVEAATVASSGAEQASGTGVFVGDGTSYRDCLGEMAHVHNEMPFRWHMVVTPSGNVMFSDPFISNAGTGQTEGLASGRIWTLDRVVSPEVISTNAGVEAHFVAVLHWVSETGPSFTLHNSYRFVQNANGEVVVNSFESRCELPGNGA